MHECPECYQTCTCDCDDLWTDQNDGCRCDCSWARDQGWDYDDLGDDIEQGCVLGNACLHPDPYHLSSECFDEEIAEAHDAQGEGDDGA
jgi:hypothetical protein